MHGVQYCTCSVQNSCCACDRQCKAYIVYQNPRTGMVQSLVDCSATIFKSSQEWPLGCCFLVSNRCIRGHGVGGVVNVRKLHVRMAMYHHRQVAVV